MGRVGELEAHKDQKRWLAGHESTEFLPDHELGKAPKKPSNREAEIEVRFERAFQAKPEVLLSPTALELMKTDHARLKLQATNITEEGFTIKISVWGESAIGELGVSWVALESGES